MARCIKNAVEFRFAYTGMSFVRILRVRLFLHVFVFFKERQILARDIDAVCGKEIALRV